MPHIEHQIINVEASELNRFVLQPLERAVTNNTLSLFTATDGQQRLLVKRFGLQNTSDAEREVSQYHLLRALPFVPALLHNIETPAGRVLAYELIEGANLYDYLRTTGPTVEKEIAIARNIFDASLEMGNLLYPDYYEQLVQSGRTFSLQNPLYRGVLPDSAEKAFDRDYQEVLEILALICEYFPGIFSDRNPGNVLVSPNDNMYQVDFGILEATSPIFDLVRILRTRTFEPSLHHLRSASPNDSLLPATPLPDEEQLVRDLFAQARQKTKYPWKGTQDLFIRAFYFAALNDHIFYLSKALGLLHTGIGNPVVQSLRKKYHSQMLPLTFTQLQAMAEPVDYLEPHIHQLVIASQ